MTEPRPTAELVDPEELVALRRDAQRYRWLRTHAVRIQGSEIWYAGDALDVRVDVGLDHIALAKDVTPKRIAPRKRR